MPYSAPIPPYELRAEFEQAAARLLETLVKVHPDTFRNTEATATFKRTTSGALVAFELKIEGVTSRPAGKPDLSTIRWHGDGITIVRQARAVRAATIQAGDHEPGPVTGALVTFSPLIRRKARVARAV